MTVHLPFGARRGSLSKWARALALGLATTLGAAPLAAQAQLVLESAAPTTEDFSSLGTSATAPVPAGFVLAAGASPTYTNAANTTATTRAGGTTGTGALASNSAGGAYNFADGVTATATDRALGFLTSGSYTVPRHILLAVQNSTGAAITDLGVSYDIEKYRTGTNAFEWQFWTSPDGSTWTQVTTLTQAYDKDAANAVVNPPTTTTKSTTLTGLNLAAGATTYLRWTYTGGASTNSQGLGLDNLTLTPTLGGGGTTTPPPAAATISTGSVSPTSFCVTGSTGSASFNVPFTTTGTLGGTYSVQLSDASGAFAATTGNVIGTGGASPVAATIPAGTASGTGYRVRVLNDSPATTGTDNGQDLTVSQTPASNAVTLTPGDDQSVTTTGTGATLTASASVSNSTYTFQYGTSAGGPYQALGSATGNSYTVMGADFPGAGTYYVVAQATATTSCGSVGGTSSPVAVTVTAPATAPTITLSDTALADFGGVAVGAGSATQTFTVQGDALTGPLTITPPVGFEIRLENGAYACCPITLTPTSGSVPGTTIEVRFVPTAAQAYAASITVSGSGQPTQSVAVSGTGTAAVAPATLSTAAVTAITGTTATAGGTIATDGGSPVTARGVVWSTAMTPTIVLGTKTSDGSGSGTFSSALTGLTPGTTYYVRAYATNAVGTTYGQQLSFSTVAVPLAAEPTGQATVAQGTLGGSSVQLLLGGGPAQKRLVLATLGSTAPSTAPTDATTYTADQAFGSGQVIASGTYVVYNGSGTDVTVTNLRPGTAYSFAVYAFNDNDTPYAENYLTANPGTLTVTTPGATAALLLEENFEYPAGDLLTAHNWTAHSGAGTNSVKVVAGSLAQAGYSANSGNAAALSGSGEDVNRQFSPVYARTPAYAAFLVQVSSASTAGDYFFHFGPQTIGSTYRGRVFVRKDASTGQVQFGISSGSGAVTYAPTEYDLGSTNLLVVKYLFDESSSTASLFLNPSTDTEPAAADATATETASATYDNIGSVALRQGGASTAPSLVFDGLRVGTTFGAVKAGTTCQAPVVTAPADQTATAAYGKNTASVSFAATATGTPAPAITYTIPARDGTTTTISSPYDFAVGTTTVTATATNSCGTSAQTFAVTVTAGAASVAVLYANGGSSPTDGTVDPFLQLVNQTGAAIPYQELTVRYYLTVENFAPIQATIGYAELGTNGVQARYVALPQPAQGALGYIEYSFTSAKTLGAGGNSGRILSHINKQNYSSFNETDDYSYATNTAYAPNDHITVYRNGTLVGGTEPAPMTAAAQLQAESANQTTETARNTIDVVTQLDNLSTVAVPYQDLTVRYWFTPDGPSPVQGSVGYAQLGTSAVSLTLGQAGTQPYAELHFDASLGSLAPLGNSGQIIFHLNKQSYSNFTQTNDYSFRADNTLSPNTHVTIYQQGQLVYGQEPDGASAAASAVAGTTSATATAAADGSRATTLGAIFEAFPNPFTTETSLHFRPATSGPARLVVYNALGQVVKTCFDGPAAAGQDYGFVLDGGSLSAGAYVVHLQVDGKTQTMRLMLAK